MATPKIIPVIMCGGAGTRLWPASRESMPKQFLPLFGSRSPFQDAVSRVINPELFSEPIVITNEEFRFIVKDQIQLIGVNARVVLEPERRDSAPAIAAAAEIARRDDESAVLLVIAADHLIRETDLFRTACQAAENAVRYGHILTFGVHPTHPATEYGYIKPGKETDFPSVLTVQSFAEKPDYDTAVRYMEEGYFWNTGNFMFRADVILDELESREPQIAEAVRAAVMNAEEDLGCLRLDATNFRRSPKKSIDYAVMEHTKIAAVLPVSFEWSDIGNWNAIWDLSRKDEQGNVAHGPSAILESRNVYVESDDHILTSVVGLDDIIVITTVDAVLVVPRDKAHKVKELVETLKFRNRREASEHKRGYRPWGYYQSVDTGPRFQVKRIVVKPGEQLSLQKHVHRAEHWVVVHGTAEVTVDDRISLVCENESVYIPLGSVHRLANPGKIPLELIEVQVGSYLGEDDIIRLEDIYNRGAVS